MPVLMLAILMSGCVEFGLDPIEDQTVERSVAVTETFVQHALPKVDLLFVVDQTASMAQEHEALADAAGVLGEQLAAAGVAWQVGVIGTDMADEEGGWLLGQPWVLTPSSGDVAAHLEAVLVAVDGVMSPEAGLAAALTALELAEPGGPNAGFRRFDAGLHVVFMSDADDASEGVLTDDPVQAMLDRLAIEGANGLPAVVSAVVGDSPGGCVSAMGNAQAGTQYIAVAEATGGEVVSICATDFGPIIEEIGNASIVLKASFTLNDTPVSDAVTVQVDGEPASGWALDYEIPAVIFDEPPEAGALVAISYLIAVVD